jgi:DNA-binding SARP family transcriptional activator/tetratricopeptide (TPR) repeat protein
VPRLECGLLGPVAVWLAGRPLELGPVPQRAVLGVLLATPDSPVPARDLVDRIWGRRAPATGTDLIYGYVSRLRRALAAAPEISLVRQHGGYRAQLDPELVDLHRFRRLVAAAAAARNAHDEQGARTLLDRALATWRGPAFGDLAAPWLDQLRLVLDRERLAATLDLGEMELRAGRHAAALPRLEALAAAEPLDERVAAQLMLARDRCGRRADALGFYVAFRRRLAADLGADPGPELQAVHQAILRGTAAAPPAPAGGQAALYRVPTARSAAGPDTAGPDTAGPDTAVPHAAGSDTAGSGTAGPAAAVPAAAVPAAAVPGAAGPGAGNGVAARPAPAQLPAAAAVFAGRRSELAALDAILVAAQRPAAGGSSGAGPSGAGPSGAGPNGIGPNGTGSNGTGSNGTGSNGTGSNGTGSNGTGSNAGLPGGAGAADGLAVVISAVSGAAGVGKSTLAVHWAHRVAHHYPDGQLFVNLRGYDPQAPVSAADALAGFLRALGAVEPEIPVGLDERAAMYRTLLHRRRVLVLLDNASSAEQVRPLLPGSPGCLVIVTSRDALGPLVAAEGAHPLTVNLLTPDEARQLLAARLGGHRVAAEPEAVAEIVARCAHLPLALAIVAARAAARPGFPLAALAAELGRTAGTLDAFDAGDATTDVRAAFSWSYQALGTPAARMFRLLGLHPTPDVGAAAAASLAGVPMPQAYQGLAELTRANLVSEHAPNRYTLHDLLGAYARSLAGGTETAAERRAALVRLLDHYVHTGHAADRCLMPARTPIALSPAATGAVTEPPAGSRESADWAHAESENLVEAIRLARDGGLDSHVWQLAWVLEGVLMRQGRWLDLVGSWQAAVRAADRLGDPERLAYAHRNLAYAHGRLGRYADAHEHYDRALRLYEVTGGLAEHARAHQNLAILLGQQRRYEQAIEHARQALARYRRLGNDDGSAYALNSVGWYHAKLGDHAAALDHCAQALELFQRVGNRNGEAATWDSLGYSHTKLAHHAQAARCYQRAIDLYRDLGDCYNEADTLTNLGDSHHAAGESAAARRAWQQALDILTDLNHLDAEAVRTRLSPPNPPNPPERPESPAPLNPPNPPGPPEPPNRSEPPDTRTLAGCAAAGTPAELP